VGQHNLNLFRRFPATYVHRDMWSLPNLLTLFRALAAVPVTAFVLAGWWEAAFVLFAVAAATDWLDGYLARKWDQTSDFGRFLDPIADKLMVAAVLLLLMVPFSTLADGGSLWGYLYIVAAIAIILRELFVSGLREFLGPKGIVVPVSGLAKWKTALQLVAIAALLLGGALWPHTPDFSYVATRVIGFGLVVLALAAVVAWITAWSYLRAGLRHMETS